MQHQLEPLNRSDRCRAARRLLFCWLSTRINRSPIDPHLTAGCARTPPLGDGHYPAIVTAAFFPILMFGAALTLLYVVIRTAVRAGIEDAWRGRQDRNDQIEE